MVYGQRVTTDAERLATVEARLVALAEQVEYVHADLAEKIDGGPHVEWERSLRGRLHALESESAAAKAAGRALAEAQRERRLATQERLTSRRDHVGLIVKVAGVIVAAVAVALPYVVHIVG